MKAKETSLPGVILLEPTLFGDERGYFLESWNRRRYEEIGIAANFVQDNISFSENGILRGLHFQNPQPQGKLVQVLQGAVFDVAVDIRVGSPHFGRWYGETLSSANHLQLYVPEGFAHGFCVISETALFAYKCTDFYHSKTEFSVRWDDPDLGIKWPLEKASLSEKDQKAVRLKDIPEESLPRFAS